jgi:outer membrane autotransporter protein
VRPVFGVRGGARALPLALTAAVCAVLHLWTADPAAAACQTTTQVVAPGATFTNTGCISTTNVDAVDAGPGSTVTNSATGSITLTTNNLLTHAINGTGNFNVFTNNGVINVISGVIAGDGMNVSGSSNTMTNNGTINLLGGLNGMTDGIFASSNKAINNGTIDASKMSGIAIDLDNKNDVAINNGSILLGGLNAIGIFSASGLATNNVSLINNGVITYLSGTNGAAIECSVGCNITNSATGIITLGASTSQGIFTGGSGTVINDGQIIVTGTSSSAINTQGNSNTVANRGTILVSGPNSFGIQITDANNTVFTPGTVTKVSNSGTITATGQGSYGVAFATQFLLFFTPLPSTGNQFFNSGLVQAGPGAIAIGDVVNNNVKPTLNSVFNSGTIDGQIALSQGTSESLTNSGLITISYPGSGIVHSIKDGTFTQTAAGTLALRVDPNGSNDKLFVIGVANLGGNLQVLAQGTGFAESTTYTIVTATAGVNGTFANATSNLPLLTPIVTYDANDAYLTFKRINLCSIAVTSNQCSVANALQQFPAGNALIAAVLGQTIPGARQAFDALSGEIHGTVQTTIFDDAFYARQAVLGRLRQATFAGGAGPMAALGTGGPAIAYAEPDDPFLAYADARRPVLPIKAPPLRADDLGLAFWAQGIGAWGRINSDGNAADASRNLAGFFTGFDRRFGDWRAGLAGGFIGSSVGVGARLSSASVDTALLSAYGGTSYGPWNLRTGAVLAWNQVSTNRSILFPGFFDAASAHYGADTQQIFAEVGYGLTLGPVAAEPFAGLAFVRLHTDGFNEAAAIAGLNGVGNTDSAGYSTLGLRVAATFALANGMAVTPRAALAWQHLFGPVTPVASLAFQTTGIPFTVAGLPLARDEALVEAGFDVRVHPQATVGLFYVGRLASSAQDHSVKGNFTWKF